MEKGTLDNKIVCPACSTGLLVIDESKTSAGISQRQLSCENCNYIVPEISGVFDMEKPENSLLSSFDRRKQYNQLWERFQASNAKTSPYNIEKKIVKKYQSLFRDKIVVDAGVGDGRHLQIIQDEKPKGMICIDAHDIIYLASSRHLSNASTTPTIFIKASLGTLSLKERSIDTLWCVGVLTVFKDPYVVCANMMSWFDQAFIGATLSSNVFGKFYHGLNPLMPPLSIVH